MAYQTDNFLGTASLTGTSTDAGNGLTVRTWTMRSGSATRASGVLTWSGAFHGVIPTGTTDHHVHLVGNAGADGTTRAWSVTARDVDSSNFLRLTLQKTSGGTVTVELFKVVGGSATSVSGSLSSTQTANADFSLTLIVSGTNVKIAKDGLYVGTAGGYTVSDGALQTAANVGIRVESGSVGSFQMVHASQRVLRRGIDTVAPSPAGYPAGAMKLEWYNREATDTTDDTKIANRVSMLIMTVDATTRRASWRAINSASIDLRYMLSMELHDSGITYNHWCYPVGSGTTLANDYSTIPETSMMHVTNSTTRISVLGNPVIDFGSAGGRTFVASKLRGSLYGDGVSIAASNSNLRTPHGGGIMTEGIFFDNCWLNLSDAPGALNGTGTAYNQTTWTNAFVGYFAFLRLHVGPLPLFLGNMIELTVGSTNAWDAYLPYMDGVMPEGAFTGFSTGTMNQTATQRINMLTQLETYIAAGKFIVPVGQNRDGGSTVNTTAEQQARQLFSFACTLLCADPNLDYAYYRWNGGPSTIWVAGDTTVTTHTGVTGTVYQNYPNMDVDYGVATDSRTNVSGNLWRRHFQNTTTGLEWTVSADLAAHTASITSAAIPDPPPVTGRLASVGRFAAVARTAAVGRTAR